MRVLVLGGTGLISAAITRELVSSGAETSIYTRGRTAREPPRGVREIRGDRFDHASFRRQLGDEQPFDVVIDMICFSATDAQDLVAALSGRTGQVIFCSTVEVYSRRPQAGPPVVEESPRQPSNSYGIGKVAAEDALRAAEGAGAFAVTILRPAYTYGEGGTLISALEGDYPARLRANRPIVVPGDGYRSWVTCHRDDVARAFVAAAGSAKAAGRTYNVTGMETTTWNDYHHTVARLLGAETPRLVHVPLDVLKRASPALFKPRSFIFDSHYSFDSSAARHDLGFRPGKAEDSLGRMVGWLERAGRLVPPAGNTFEDVLADAWTSAVHRFVTEVEGEHP